MKVLQSVALAFILILHAGIILVASSSSPAPIQVVLLGSGIAFYWLASVRFRFFRFDLIAVGLILSLLCALPLMGVWPLTGPLQPGSWSPALAFVVSAAMCTLGARLITRLRPPRLTTAMLRALEESLWRTQTRFDRTHCAKVFADDFIEFGRSGRVWSRSELIEAEPRKIECELPLPEFRTRMLTRELVQATYISIVQNPDGGQDAANRSSLWRWEKGRWRICFSQGTPCDLPVSGS